MKALITGVTGQSGSYLAEYLLELGYEVYGGVRRSSGNTKWRLTRLEITDHIKFIDFELSEHELISQVISKYQFDEIYNLAAMSFVGHSFKAPLYSMDINAMGVFRILESIRLRSPHTKLYQASTSEMYGKIQQPIQNENTAFYPRSPYGIAKLAAHFAVVNYREAYDLFGCSGILFNHESPLRGLEFVTRKVVNQLCQIQQGASHTLEIGNIQAMRDWGYAKDYIVAMHSMLQQDTAANYVIATGKKHSVKDLIDGTADYLNLKLEWQHLDHIDSTKITAFSHKLNRTIITINPDYWRPTEVDVLIGDASLAKQKLNWSYKTNFQQLLELMIDDELKYMQCN